MIVPTPIRTREELVRLQHRSGRRGIRSIILELHGDAPRLRHAEARINRNLHPCGCELAALLLAATIAVLGTIATRDVLAGASIDITRILCMGLAAVSAVVIGKVAGIVGGEIRLARAIREVLASTSWPADR
jgi:hypothetical protein